MKDWLTIKLYAIRVMNKVILVAIYSWFVSGTKMAYLKNQSPDICP
jgi:hypothetical protein